MKDRHCGLHVILTHEKEDVPVISRPNKMTKMTEGTGLTGNSCRNGVKWLAMIWHEGKGGPWSRSCSLTLALSLLLSLSRFLALSHSGYCSLAIALWLLAIALSLSLLLCRSCSLCHSSLVIIRRAFSSFTPSSIYFPFISSDLSIIL